MTEQGTAKIILRSLRGIPIDCGCVLDWNEDAASITYCLAHAAAPKYKAALEEIKRDQGRVCENYELCRHTSCSSSYSAWAIADKALRNS